MPIEIDLNAKGTPGHPGVMNQYELVGKEVVRIINQGVLSVESAMKVLEWFAVLTRLGVRPDEMMAAYLRAQPIVASRFADEMQAVFGEKPKSE